MDTHTQMHYVVFHQLCQGTAGLRPVKFAAPASLSFPGVQSSEVLLRWYCSAYQFTGCRGAKICL